MPRKTIIIFITVFAIVSGLLFGYYYYTNKKSTNTGAGGNTGYNVFNPFNNTNNKSSQTQTSDQTNTNDAGPTDTTDTQAVQAPSVLHQITTFAVAGAVYFEDSRELPQAEQVVETPQAKGKTKKPAPKAPTPKYETVPSLRYVERATGHIYQMYLDNKNEGKISNSTIPSIYEAVWGNTKAQSVIYRYLNEDGTTISSYLAALSGAKGEFLPTNITDLSVSQDKTKFFYLVENASGVVGYVRNFADTKSALVFNSPFTEWLSQWAGPQKIFLTTKASAEVNGDLFVLNTNNGIMTKVLSGIKGLTTLSNSDGSMVIYSSSGSSGPQLLFLKTKDHSITTTNTYGLPEKCVWSSDNVTVYCAVPNNIDTTSPDAWYQGKVSFDDHFIKINTATNTTSDIVNSLNDVPVDATKLFLNKDETSLFFINKKDSTLWSLDLR